MESAFDGILAAARAGGEWAWAYLYDEYSPRLLAYARSRGAVEPEDLVGEVFLQVVRDLTGFEGGEPQFRGWIFTIARNRVIDDHRRRRRRPYDSTAPDAISLIGETGDVEAEALASLGDAEVRELLTRLTPDQRDVLFLRIIADLPVEQVADVMGKRPGAVKALQRRGLSRLEEILDSSVTISKRGTL